MNYIDLKAIIKHLKKNLPCGQCGKKFPDEGINLISALNDETLFHFKCPFCQNQLIAQVSIVEQDRKAQKLNVKTKKAESLSPNDVLDIHNFLDQFDGDFKTLFSNTKSSGKKIYFSLQHS
ncbi:MAG TPA: hypothetical protein P5229_02595 [Candidatus Gracilibacteria bacterium]|nr:hypothetical protein [Candidatus Gracilibacteria bacterium]